MRAKPQRDLDGLDPSPMVQTRSQTVNTANSRAQPHATRSGGSSSSSSDLELRLRLHNRTSGSGVVEPRADAAGLSHDDATRQDVVDHHSAHQGSPRPPDAGDRMRVAHSLPDEARGPSASGDKDGVDDASVLLRQNPSHVGSDNLSSFQLPSALYGGSGTPTSPGLFDMDARGDRELFPYDNNRKSCDPGGGGNLEVGHVVEISIHSESHSGVVRWLGCIPDDDTGKLVAGLEMDIDNPLFSDGTYMSVRYFNCPPSRGLFVYAHQCKRDPRLYESTLANSSSSTQDVGTPAAAFGGIACPRIPGHKPPLNMANSSDLQSICGQNKGIQGHHNSCYLDATLFSMFAFIDVFDSVLFREKMQGDIPEYDTVQTALSQDIVNPLRTNMYVRADNVMNLRFLLDKFGSVTGLTCEEKDPEEFLNSLLQQILKAKPFLKLSSGQESFYYQLFVEKNERITFPTVQYLLQQSFYSSNVKLQQEPSCLIILMPRFGKQYKVYSKIFPNLDLDVSEIIENVPQLCSICGDLATSECMACFQESTTEDYHCAYCDHCVELPHQHSERKKHKPRKLALNPYFLEFKECAQPKPIDMKLFAVVCIETSHYVAFVKCGQQPDSPWCFFDSMADRKGGQNGFNIPEVVPCPDLNFWLTNEGYQELKRLNPELSSSSSQPPHVAPDYVKRLLSDAYLCMYYSPTVSMYS